MKKWYLINTLKQDLSWGGSAVKNLPTNAGDTRVWSQVLEDPMQQGQLGKHSLLAACSAKDRGARHSDEATFALPQRPSPAKNN